MSKIALSMICLGTGDEPKHLERCLLNIAPWVDAIYITITGPRNMVGEVEKICKKYNVNVTYESDKFIYTVDQKMVDFLKDELGWEAHAQVGDKIFLFDEARNYNLSQVPKEYEWFMWLDVDDVFRGGKDLRDVVKDGEEKGLEAIYFNYLYQVDTDETQENIKNIIIEHLRERLLRNNGAYKWIANIHETLIEQRGTIKADDPRCDVVHLANEDKRIKSLERNLNALEYSIYRKEAKDPRPIYYLAKAYFDVRKPEYDDKCITLINRYLHGNKQGEHKSGWPEERAQAWEYLAEVYRRKGEHMNSIIECMNGLIENPELPSLYLNIAVSYMLFKEYERALFWIKMSSHVPQRKTTLIKSPKDTQVRTLQVIYEACLNLNKVDQAWASAHKLYEILPDDPMILNNFKFIEMVKQERDLSKYITIIANHLKQTGEVAKIKPLLAAVPAFMQNNPFVVDLYKQNNPPKYWDEKEIAILCGPGFTNWSPKRLTDPQGSFVGGSEEAVIRIADELQKQGWQVTVYADPGQDEGEYGNVKWQPYYKLNRLDHFNILLIWRVPQHLDLNLNAKQTYLWCHDIQNNLDYTPERISKVTKVFFLSKWHRDNVPNLPDDKVVISSNGFD